jgi:hypothetical protein
MTLNLANYALVFIHEMITNGELTDFQIAEAANCRKRAIIRIWSNSLNCDYSNSRNHFRQLIYDDVFPVHCQVFSMRGLVSYYSQKQDLCKPCAS